MIHILTDILPVFIDTGKTLDASINDLIIDKAFNCYIIVDAYWYMIVESHSKDSPCTKCGFHNDTTPTVECKLLNCNSICRCDKTSIIALPIDIGNIYNKGTSGIRSFKTYDDNNNINSIIIPNDVKLNEIFLLDGVTYMCVDNYLDDTPSDKCMLCSLHDHMLCHRYSCSTKERNDKTSAYFKKI